jgi:putative aldouronate transport system substrate-binding protein
MMNMVKYNGKMMALPGLNIGYQDQFIWLRGDWMDKLKLPDPKTMADVTNILTQFKQKDPGKVGKNNVIPLMADTSMGSVLLAGNYNSVCQLDPFFNYYGAYPQTWLKQPNGSIAYGTIQPQMIPALTNLASYYKNGLISSQFAVTDYNTMIAELGSGKVGAACGAWWVYSWPLQDLPANVKGAYWKPYLIPQQSNGTLNTYAPTPVSGWIVVRKGFAYPEIATKIYDACTEGTMAVNMPDLSSQYPNYVTVPSAVYNWSRNPVTGAQLDWGNWPYHMQVVANNGALIGAQQGIETMNAVTSKKLTSWANSGLNFTPPNSISFYQSAQKAVDGNLTTGDNLQYWYWYAGYKAEVDAKMNMLKNQVFPLPTKTQALKQSNLNTLMNQMMLQIITGKQPVSYFNTFVKQWLAQGGSMITSEVNAQFK